MGKEKHGGWFEELSSGAWDQRVLDNVQMYSQLFPSVSLQVTLVMQEGQGV